MAPIGSLKTSFTLDKTNYQGSEPITGVASVSFSPTAGASSTSGLGIFGLLKLRVVLQGRLLLNVAENRTSHACIFFNEKRILFTKHEELINGPYRAAAKETTQFPFKIRFPVLTDSLRGHRDLLPPSFDAQFSAVAQRQVGRHHGAALVEYSVRVEIEMPAIDVSISNETPLRRVTWQPPGELVSSARNEFTQALQLQSYALLPEQDRPSLFQKTIARINSEAKPSYKFSVTCVGYPDVIPVGRDIQFDLRIRNESNGTTTDNIPEVSLGECRVDLVARTQMYATNFRGADSARIEGLETEATLSLLKASPDGPFNKENDFSKKLIFTPIPASTASTFLIKKLGRSYRLHLDIQFLVAEQKISLERNVNVRILPPFQQRDAPPVAGPSRVAAGVSRRRESDDLPNYDEIGHSAPPFQQHL